jgi:DNA invertase Pin-like site-specific DNA recombinase
MSEFVAYYRVSTDKQGERGLGIEAQREAVGRAVRDGEIVAEFTEVESGKKHTNRPELIAALKEAKRRRAVLVIAKLDRLARNVHFISGLMESGVEFIAADMPHASKLTVHIMAAFAEHEREAISERTKAALQQIKKELQLNGFRVSKAKKTFYKLGNPHLDLARQAAAIVNRNHPATFIVSTVRDMRADKKTWRQIAERLNGMMVQTGRGKIWYGSTVRSMFIRAEKEGE